MPISKSELLAIAACCRNSAAMLQLADSGETDPEKRSRLSGLNFGQAKLLIDAALIAEQGAFDDVAEPTVSLSAKWPAKELVARETVDLIYYIATGKKIDAIKSYRALTGHGLAESKTAIESVMNKFGGAQ